MRRPSTNVLLATIAALILMAQGRTVVADLSFGTPTGTIPLLNGGFDGSLLSPYPGTSGPTFVQFIDGFGVTDFRLQFTSSASNVGQPTTIQEFWADPVGISPLPQGLAVEDFIDLDVTLSGGASVQDIQLIAGLTEGVDPGGSFLSPLAIADTGAVGESGHVSASDGTAFFNWDPGAARLVSLGAELDITFVPTAAGQVFTFDFPGSVKFSLPTSPTPEPSTFVPAGFGALALIGYGWWTRRRALA